jgi:hypothetical protein
LTGHLRIGRMAKIGSQAGVMSDVDAGAEVIGSPSQPRRAFFREVAVLRRMARGGGAKGAAAGDKMTGDKTTGDKTTGDKMGDVRDARGKDAASTGGNDAASKATDTD